MGQHGDRLSQAGSVAQYAAAEGTKFRIGILGPVHGLQTGELVGKQAGSGLPIRWRRQRARVGWEGHKVVSPVAAAVVLDGGEGGADRPAHGSDHVEVAEGEEVVRRGRVEARAGGVDAKEDVEQGRGRGRRY